MRTDSHAVRRAPVTMRVLLGTAIAAVVLLMSAACMPDREEVMDNIVAIEEAVGESFPRAASVDAERDTSGTSTGYVARITVSDASPLTADELSNVLTAMRESTPESTGYLSVIAYVGSGDDRESVDVKAAADELGLRYTGFFMGITVGTSDVDAELL